MLEVAQIDRNRLGEREHRAACGDHEQRQQYSAERIDMVKRVERHPSTRARSLITQGISGKRVRALMDDDADDDGKGADKQRFYI